MGSLSGRDTNGLLKRPFGLQRGAPAGSVLLEGNFAEPLYQRIEHGLGAGSRAVGDGGTHPEH